MRHSKDVSQFLLRAEHEWLTNSFLLSTHFNRIIQNVYDEDQEVGTN
jgi:hypothetical protein